MAQKIKSQKHTYNMTSLIYLYENEQNQITDAHRRAG